MHRYILSRNQHSQVTKLLSSVMEAELVLVWPSPSWALPFQGRFRRALHSDPETILLGFCCRRPMERLPSSLHAAGQAATLRRRRKAGTCIGTTVRYYRGPRLLVEPLEGKDDGRGCWGGRRERGSVGRRGPCPRHLKLHRHLSSRKPEELPCCT